MKPKAWYILLMLTALLAGQLLISCDEKGTEPEDALNVSNNNPHCGLVAGFVRSSEGEGLEDVTVSIFPASSARAQGVRGSEALSQFLNYPNPFTSDTYFIYYLVGPEAHTMKISIYNLYQELQREFTGAPTAEGANKFYFDGLDLQEEALPDGLYPCEVLVFFPEDTASARIALSKNVNITADGGLQSYRVTTKSNGKYVIADVPMNILLQATTTFSPEDTLYYPGNWPYVETLWELSDHFVVSASKQGYDAVEDTVILTEGLVTRNDFTLR